MSPRGSKRHPVSPADAHAYLNKASAWLHAADESLQARRWDVAAGSAVTAGINACDSLSGALLGQRAGGEHSGAANLLNQAGADGRQLAQLLRYKTPSQYDPPRYPSVTPPRPSSWPAGWSNVLHRPTPGADRPNSRPRHAHASR